MIRGNGSLGIGLVRPAILIPAAITMTTKVLEKKVLKCLWVRKVVDLGLLIPDILSQVIEEVVEVGQV